MEYSQYERRGLFDGLRVPFEPNMLLLALAFVVGFHWVVLFLEWALDAPELLLRVVAGLGGPALYEGAYGPLSPIAWFMIAVVALGFWSFFSVAINRIAAMKIAREETVELGDAARFAVRKFVPAMWTVGFVGIIFILFYALMNATLFGWIGRIPYLGEFVVAVVLYPLVILFTILVVIALVLGVFGFNIASSAIATESSDTYEGISRSSYYLLVRPWTVLLVLGLTFAYIAVFAFAGSKVMSWSVDSLAVGSWGMGAETRLEAIKGEDLPGEIRQRTYDARVGPGWEESEEHAARREQLDKQEFYVAVPGSVAFIRGFVSGPYTWGRADFAPSAADLERLERRLGEEELARRVEALANRQPGNVAPLMRWSLKLGAVVIYLWHWILLYLIAAYALQYFLGANTMLYFLLRKEVEGEDYNEIVVDEDELDEYDAWNVAEPEAPGAAPTKGGAGSLIMPASKPGGPAAAVKPAGDGGEAEAEASESQTSVATAEADAPADSPAPEAEAEPSDEAKPADAERPTEEGSESEAEAEPAEKKEG